MHICNYCGTSFIPRAQTKKPKACTNRKCQKQRQRDNEKAWKIKNQGLYDGSYFRIKRLQRIKQLRKLAERWFKFLEVGSRFLKDHLQMDYSKMILCRFFLSLGIRRVNKLWGV